MQPRDRPVGTRSRGCGVVLRIAIGAVVLAGCGVLELGDAPHAAVVLEPAQRADGDRWTVVVELLQTEIAGAAVVTVTFDGGEVPCAAAGSIPAEELLPATELRFDQGGDGVEQPPGEDEPPVVSGVQLAVACD